jgi:hypothetical protein
MTRDELNLTADETAILDDMVARREATFQKPQYMQSYRATRLKMIAREEIAALPPKPPATVTDRRHYDTNRRVMAIGPSGPGRIHEADADDLPICQLKGSTWFAPGHPVKVLGPGPVTCGHCANAALHR